MFELLIRTLSGRLGGRELESHSARVCNLARDPLVKMGRDLRLKGKPISGQFSPVGSTSCGTEDADTHAAFVPDWVNRDTAVAGEQSE